MIPAQLQKILDDLKSQEWVVKLAQNSEVYIVGGSVRDAYIGKPIKDVDLVIDGLSFSGIQKILTPYGKQNLVGESFSVIKFKPHGYEGEDYDIAIPREDRKVGEGHKDFEIITNGVDITGDLKRRDFTINSIAVNVITGEMIDPFNGRQDLQNKIIRATDNTAFIEDPLRILRGIQFASRFNFDIEQKTLKMMKDNAHLIGHLSGERILEEFEKIINKGDTQIGLNLLYKTDVDKSLFGKKMLQYNEGFEKLDPVSFYYMLAMVGDVSPYEFYMKRLKGNVEIGNAIKTLDTLITQWERTTDEEERLWIVFSAISKVPSLVNVVLLPIEVDKIVKRMQQGEIPINPKSVPLTGDDVMAIFGIPKGKKVGDILMRVRKDALMNRFNWHDKEETLRYVDSLNLN